MAVKTTTTKSKSKPAKTIKAKKAVRKTAPKLVSKASLKKKVDKSEAKVKKAAVKKTAPKKTVVKKSSSIDKKEKLMAKKTPKTEKVSKVKKTPKVKAKKEVSKRKVIQPEVKQEVIKAEPRKPIKGYSKKDLEHFRAIILEKRDEIIEQLQNLKEQMLDPTTGEYINENSPYSLHMAEQGTDAMEREKIFLYAQRENKFLGYLEDALKRIDAGTYGICIECIDEPQHLCETCPLIPKARLEAVPHSQLCLQIKQKQEKK
jgi:DnaK suppressor protein